MRKCYFHTASSLAGDNLWIGAMEKHPDWEKTSRSGEILPICEVYLAVCACWVATIVVPYIRTTVYRTIFSASSIYDANDWHPNPPQWLLYLCPVKTDLRRLLMVFHNMKNNSRIKRFRQYARSPVTIGSTNNTSNCRDGKWKHQFDHWGLIQTQRRAKGNYITR